MRRDLILRERTLWATEIEKNMDGAPIDDLLISEGECVLQEVYGGCAQKRTGRFFKNEQGGLVFDASRGGHFFAEIRKSDVGALDSCLS